MKRRSFLKRVGLAAAGTASATAFPKLLRAAPVSKGSKKPNILVIIVDQLRFPQGSFNQPLLDAAAPNLASLRQQSVSFDAHYAAATACSPSRSTMLTGLYTHQNGMFLTNAQGLAGQPPTPSMNPGFPTWGSILRSAQFGYQTYWWGKWHLSSDDQTGCGYITKYGFQGGLPLPSPNGGPGQGLGVDPQTTSMFKTWLDASAASGPWCTTVSLVNPHDVQWFPKYSMTTPGEDNPPPIPQFHTGLPANFESWPEALFNQGKPSLQQAWVVLTDSVFGFMPQHPTESGYPDLWFQLLDLYYAVTSYVDVQIGAVLNALAQSSVADNTIVIFTSDHGEYGGAHGMRGKAFALYEEGIHVPLYVNDPTGTFVPSSQVGTSRSGLTSHVDFVPFLMTLASGGNDWRKKPAYAHLAGRADLAAMLSNPNAPARQYILHTSDEDIPEEATKLGIPYKDALISNILPPPPAPQVPPPTHAIGYRTQTAKLGVYSYFTPGSINIQSSGQQAELYDYANNGIGEVTNNAPGGSSPEPTLYNQLYDALFNPTGGAVATELRQPLPPFLGEVQRRAIADYVNYEASL
jgi:arylsulfatase A-like enzyme